MRDEEISIDDYKRIFETIYSVLKFVGLSPEKNCTYFSLIGAALLHEHFGIVCKSYSGAASYYLNDKENMVLGFAEKIGPNKYIGSINGFHSWNHNEEHVIDFQAPLFQEMARAQFGQIVCEKKMFQRKIIERCQSPSEFKKTGDFFLSPDLELGKQVVDMFAEDPLNMDMLNICINWFVNPISKMKSSCKIRANTGELKVVDLHKIQLSGKW